MLKNTFWFSFLAASQSPAVGVCLLNYSKMRTTNSWILDLSKCNTLSPVPEELVLQFEPWRHSTSLSFLASKGIKTSLKYPVPPLSHWLWWSGGQWASWQHMDAQISFSVRPLSHTPPATLSSAHKKEEKWKMPAGSFLSCPGEEEKITLKVKQSKPPTGYMTPSLNTSFRKEIFLGLL